jgi:hypothetical protein
MRLDPHGMVAGPPLAGSCQRGIGNGRVDYLARHHCDAQGPEARGQRGAPELGEGASPDRQ